METQKYKTKLKAIFSGNCKEFNQSELANILGVNFSDVPGIVEQVDDIRPVYNSGSGETAYIKGLNL